MCSLSVDDSGATEGIGGSYPIGTILTAGFLVETDTQQIVLKVVAVGREPKYSWTVLKDKLKADAVTVKRVFISGPYLQARKVGFITALVTPTHVAHRARLQAHQRDERGRIQ